MNRSLLSFRVWNHSFRPQPIQNTRSTVRYSRPSITTFFSLEKNPQGARFTCRSGGRRLRTRASRVRRRGGGMGLFFFACSPRSMAFTISDFITIPRAHN